MYYTYTQSGRRAYACWQYIIMHMFDDALVLMLMCIHTHQLHQYTNIHVGVLMCGGLIATPAMVSVGLAYT
jgi:hypothetical protein